MTSAIRGIARASELPSPALPNHFLQKFGQSDRISIDGATNEGSLTQTLQLLNVGRTALVPADNGLRLPAGYKAFSSGGRAAVSS